MATELWAARSAIPEAETLIRRYFGLPDANGKTETWAYAYYDARPSLAGDDVTAEDVAAAAVFGMRLSRACLEGFERNRAAIAAVISTLAEDLSFEVAPDEVLETIESLQRGLVTGEGGPVPKIADSDRTLISAILHRKRPRLIPLYNRVVADRYAFGLGDKAQARGVNLLKHMRADVADPRNAEALREIQSRLAVDLDGRPVPSRIRLFDIAMWMDSRSPP